MQAALRGPPVPLRVPHLDAPSSSRRSEPCVPALCRYAAPLVRLVGRAHGSAAPAAHLHPPPPRRNFSRDRGLRALLEAVGSIAVLFVLSWQLAPALATVIVATGVAAALFRRATRPIEARLSDALTCLSRVAGQAFANIRTVRSFAGASPPTRRRLTLPICGSDTRRPWQRGV
jgi:ABC transporter transmembrane region